MNKLRLIAGTTPRLAAGPKTEASPLAAPKDQRAEAVPPRPQLMEPVTYKQMADEVQLRTAVLCRLVRSAVAAPNDATRQLLERLEAQAATLSPHNSIEVKHQLREVIWPLRQALESGGCDGLEVRRALEKARTVCFDLTYEGAEGLAAFPHQNYTVHARPPISDIANYQVVAPGVLRGSQPTQGGVDWLVSHEHVVAEVDLRGGDRDNQWTAPAWGNVKHYPLAMEDRDRPTFDQVIQFKSWLDDESNLPIFVHCKAGIGRTGALIACWRITHGWTADEAIALERLQSYDGSIEQEQFIRDFDEEYRGVLSPAARPVVGPHPD